MDSILKLKSSIDVLFGTGVSKSLPNDVDITYSRKNGRIKSVYHNGKILCTLRIDGGLAISLYFAQILLKNKKFKENCLEISSEAAPYVELGKSVFCKYVMWCGKKIMIGSDTPVLYNNQVIAIGRAVLPSTIIKSMKRGVAVKIRDSLKSQSEEILS